MTLDFCRDASKYGLDVTLVATGKGELFDEFKNSGVNFIFIERKMPVDFRLVYKLKRIVEKNGIKVIHAHQAVDGVHAYLTKLFTNVKTVMSFHGHNPSKKNDLALKFLIPRMDANIAVSKSFLNRLKNDIKFDTTKNFYVVYNGIDPNKFYKTSGTFRKELDLYDSDILLGSVGNFYNTGRDQLTICKSLPNVYRKYKNVHFVFIGGRSEKNPHFYDECYNYCKNNNILDRTHFVGSRTDINDILNSLDVFVYSSNHDTFGISVIEAMMSGLPVIINNLSTLLEVTDNGKYAIVFKSKCSEDLENKIIELIENKDKRGHLAAGGEEWALSQFSIENYITNLKKLYFSL